MQLANFKGAFGDLVKSESTTVTINDQLSLSVLALGNQTYARRNGEFARKNPKHQLATDQDQFNLDLVNREITPAVIDWLANVVITDWTLIDDNGKSHPFTVKLCVDLLNQSHGIGRTIASRVIDTALDQKNFTVDWESVVTKNS